MSRSRSVWCAVALAVALVTGVAADKKDKDEKAPAKARPAQPQKPPRNEVSPPKVAPQAPRQNLPPKAAPPQVRETPVFKAPPQERQQPPQTKSQQAPKTFEHPTQPTVEKKRADQLPDRAVKVQPEKSKPQPVAPPASKDKDVKVHARQPSTTLKPEHTQVVKPKPPPFKLTAVKKPDGVVEKVSPSNKVRERTTVDKKLGDQRTQRLSVTGKVEVEEVKRKDGSRQLTQYDLGREKRLQVVRKDGCIETTDVHYNRNGEPRARETIVCDKGGRAVSKTVIVQQNLVIKNTTIVHNNIRVANNSTTVVRNYNPGRYGFVYRPVVRPVVYVSWYDPYWYSPVGVALHRPFRYSWGWYSEPWYTCHSYYWSPYPVYSSPCYWVTDWIVAAYVADRWAAATSAAQAREETRLAREEAEKARIAAEQARDAAEIAEARAAVAAAEARAERAEARAAKAELEEARAKELAGKPNSNATPIDKETKDALKDQIEKTIAEKKRYAEQSENGGNANLPDVMVSLSNPKHIFPVSKTISVIRAEDSKPAGVLTAGDLLRAEPGQEKLLAEASENTPITMRVITSKGEDESVPAGTLVAIPLSELQEFDNEFRAKIDLGLTEASNNKELFKKEVVN